MSEVAILGVGAFVHSYGDLDAWAQDARDESVEKPTGDLVPKRERRRASPLSRAMADAYRDALGMAELEASTVASVFGSALGEASTMIALLDQMWDAKSPISPMKFATSVHNAASGTISIATQNRGYTTSIGADFDTSAMALIEGIARVGATGECVVICCGDEDPPPDLVPDGAGWSLMAAAVALGPLDSPSDRVMGRLGVPTLGDGPAEVPKARDVVLERNPSIGLLDLATAVAQKEGKGATVRVALDRGAGRGYASPLTRTA